MIIKRIKYLEQSYYIDIQNRLEEYASRGLILVDICYEEFIFEKAEPISIKYELIYSSNSDVLFIDEDRWNLIAENEYVKVYACKESTEPDIQTNSDKVKDINNNLSRPIIKSNNKKIIHLLFYIGITLNLNNMTSVLSKNYILVMFAIFIAFLVQNFFCSMEYIYWHKKSLKKIISGEKPERNKVISYINKFINVCTKTVFILTACIWSISLGTLFSAIMTVILLLYYIPKILILIKPNKQKMHKKYKLIRECFGATILIISIIVGCTIIISEESGVKTNNYNLQHITEYNNSLLLEKTKGQIDNNIFEDKQWRGRIFCSVYKFKYNFVKELVIKDIDNKEEARREESIINDDIKVYKYNIPKDKDIGNYFISYKDYIIYIELDSQYRVLSYMEENYYK